MPPFAATHCLCPCPFDFPGSGLSSNGASFARIKKLGQLWSATQDSRNALNRSRTGENPFFNLFVQISGQIWTVVGRGYFSLYSSRSENVASARRVAAQSLSETSLYFDANALREMRYWFTIRVVNFFITLLKWSQSKCIKHLIGSLSSDVFERRTSSGREPFPLLISLDATVFILPSVLILTETICPKICSKSRLKSAKLPFPVDVRRSKTSLLKLPNVCGGGYKLYCGGW